MYISKEDFKRRMFEGLMRSEFPTWKITFVWDVSKDRNPRKTILDTGLVAEVRTVINPEWEKLGPKYDVQFFGPAFNGPGASL